MNLKEKYYQDRLDLFLSQFEKLKQKKYFKNKLRCYKIIARKNGVSEPMVRMIIEGKYNVTYKTNVAS